MKHDGFSQSNVRHACSACMHTLHVNSTVTGEMGERWVEGGGVCGREDNEIEKHCFVRNKTNIYHASVSMFVVVDDKGYTA